jgi:putative transposase
VPQVKPSTVAQAGLETNALDLAPGDRDPFLSARKAEEVTMTAAFCIGVAAVVLLVPFAVLRSARHRPRFLRRPFHPAPTSHPSVHKKPEWVRNEVIRLKALMPHDHCRTIASTFNRVFADKGETVGKTYVAYTLKRHALEILRLRTRIKNRPRRQGPRALTFAMDITFVDQLPILGILDHGTRGLLAVRLLQRRSTVAILRALLDVIEEFGQPKFLRTDNERGFTSYLMIFVLLVLGIRHQRIDPGCPWQNGRIERLFGTLKEKLAAWWAAAGVPHDIQLDLDAFRIWYNHVRPHQSLDGITPAMAWNGVTKQTASWRYYDDWDGLLTGFVASS